MPNCLTTSTGLGRTHGTGLASYWPASLKSSVTRAGSSSTIAVTSPRVHGPRRRMRFSRRLWSHKAPKTGLKLPKACLDVLASSAVSAGITTWTQTSARGSGRLRRTLRSSNCTSFMAIDGVTSQSRSKAGRIMPSRIASTQI